jgi:hypothetical protein
VGENAPDDANCDAPIETQTIYPEEAAQPQIGVILPGEEEPSITYENGEEEAGEAITKEGQYQPVE